MATGVPLRDLLTMLRSECGHSLNVAQGTNSKEHLSHLLRRVQEQLYTMHDWPLRMRDERINVTAGSDHYNYPAQVDIDQVNWIDVQTGTAWTRLEYGITPNEYTALDPDLNQVSWPPRRWRHDEDTGQFQIWPKPSQDGVLWMRGQTKLPPLVADGDRCALDANLIVLYASAEVLSRQKSEDAQLKLSQAQSLLAKLLAQQGSQRRGPWILGGGVNPTVAHDRGRFRT